jgi:flavin-dependent dehydrogenase
LLVDKSGFPRDKVCGSCLNAAALAALRIAGMGDLPAGLGAVRLESMRIRAADREAVVSLPHGAAISRRALDLALVRTAIDAGTAFLPQTEATLDPIVSAPRKVQLRAGGQTASIIARFAVSADGLGGGFLKSIDEMKPTIADNAPLGVGAVVEDVSDCYPAGTIHMGYTPGGYVGVVRLEDGRVDIALALDRGTAQKAGGTVAATRTVLQQCGLPSPSGLAEAFFRGTPHLTRRRQHVAAEGLVVIGDAAGYIEPLTGEGMAWAMQQAILAAPLIYDSIVHGYPGRAHRWQEQYDRFFRQRRSICTAAIWMRRHYRFGGLLVGLLAFMPGLAAPWVRAVNRISPEIRQSFAL